MSDSTIIPVDGLLDIVDDRCWLRAAGYLPGPGDLPVPAAQVRRLGLRRGDRVTGVARPGGPRRPMSLQVDAVDGRPPGRRAEFGELTVLHPAERLRLSTTAERVTARAI